MNWQKPEFIRDARWTALVELLEWSLQHEDLILSTDVQHVLSVSAPSARKYLEFIGIEYPDRFELTKHHFGGRGAPLVALTGANKRFELKGNRPLPKKILRCSNCKSAYVRGDTHTCFATENDAEKRRTYMRNYMREYYKKHPQKIKDAVVKSNKKNPKEAQKRLAMRLWRKATAEGSYSVQEWLSLVAMYNYTCLACGQRKPLTADHIVPLAHGGADTIENIQPLCRACNSSKGNKTIDYRPNV